MAKGKQKQEATIETNHEQAGTTGTARSQIAVNSAMLFNELFRRRSGMTNGATRQNIEQACGYDRCLTFSDYFDSWDKGDVAKRIVEAYPDATWSQNPDVYEQEDEKSLTAFEKDWRKLSKEVNSFAALHKLDILAGIGKYGLMVIGVNDGKKLHQPLQPKKAKSESDKREIVYHRSYMEGEVKIVQWDDDPSSLRYGLPVLYEITPGVFTDNAVSVQAMPIGGLEDTKKKVANTDPFIKSFRVHHSRTIHFADYALSSPVYGRERLRQAYNRMTDILKIVGGSAEMFWQGAFSGIAFEMDPEAEITNEAKTKMKEDIDNYIQKMQRTLLLQGVKAHPLSPSIASPMEHLDAQLTLISIGTSIPKRILSGSEMGKMASTQDSQHWSGQVQTRRTTVVNPSLLLPYVQFCIRNGIVFSPAKPAEINIKWEPLMTASREERGRSAEYFTTALETYCGKALYHAMSFEDYLYHIHGYTSEEAKALSKQFNKEAFEKIRKELNEAKKSTSETTKMASAKVKSRSKEETVTEE